LSMCFTIRHGKRLGETLKLHILTAICTKIVLEIDQDNLRIKCQHTTKILTA